MAVNETQTENRNKQHQQRLPFFAFSEENALPTMGRAEQNSC
jgi:hypothetical protein